MSDGMSVGFDADQRASGKNAGQRTARFGMGGDCDPARLGRVDYPHQVAGALPLKSCPTRARHQVLALLLGTALLALHAAAARADLVATVNAIRAEGCGSKLGPQPALRTNAALSRAAEALAAGRNFKDAMSASGYRAAQSAMLEVAGID